MSDYFQAEIPTESDCLCFLQIRRFKLTNPWYASTLTVLEFKLGKNREKIDQGSGLAYIYCITLSRT